MRVAASPSAVLVVDPNQHSQHQSGTSKRRWWPKEAGFRWLAQPMPDPRRHRDADARRRRCGSDAAVAARVGVGTESLHAHVRAAGVSPTQSSVTSSTSCQTRPS